MKIEKQKSKEQKNKEGIANILSLVGICLIIGGILIAISNIQENVGSAFLMCLIGTVLNFSSTYLKFGYIKFFN
jgi:hypothetical protein